ncbi:MAG: 6-phosphofructokinase, partial [Ignavibacteriales bacterium]
VPIHFNEILDPKTGRTRIRLVDIDTESYEVAEEYMIKLKKSDFEDPEQLEKLARAAHMMPEEFVSYFSKAVRR